MSRILFDRLTIQWYIESGIVCKNESKRTERNDYRMRKYVKLIALVLAMLMLCACGGGNNDETKEPVQTTAPAVNHEPEQTEPEKTEPEETEPVETTLPQSTDVPADPVSVSEMDLSEFNVTVNQVATVSYSDDLKFRTEMPVYRTIENEIYYYTLLSAKCEDLIGKAYNNYDYFGDGLTAAYVYSESVPQCSLINVNTGEIYLSDDACQIEQLSDRFYFVIYATEQTDSREDAFIYFTDRMFSLAPEEGDILYKGYAKIFDLEQGGFVGDLILEEPYDIAVCGGLICVEIDWYTSDVYAADGTCIADDVESITVCQDMMVQETDEGVVIYDSEFNRLRTLPDCEVMDEDGPVYPNYSGKFLKVRDENSGLWGVIDMGGNVMMEGRFATISGAYGDYIMAGKEIGDDWMYGVYLADGTEILPCTYDGIYADDDLPVLHCYDAEDNDFIYVPGFGSVDVTDYSRDGLVYYVNPEEGNYDARSYLVYATGEMADYTDSEVLCQLLVYSEEAGLVEMIHGQTLIPAEDFGYDRIIDTEEYLYCFDYDTKQVTIYQVEIG